MAENIVGPNSQSALLPYLREIPLVDDETVIGRPTKRYKNVNATTITATSIKDASVDMGATFAVSDLATQDDLKEYFKADGSVPLSGDLIANGHYLANIGGLVMTNGGIFCNSVPITDCGGLSMVGNINLATHDITNTGSLNGTPVSDLAYTGATGTAGNIVTFVSGKELQDSGVAMTSLPASTAVMLLNGSQAMAADMSLGGHQITNVSNIRVSSASGDVVIGNNAATTGAAGSIAIGDTSTADLDGVAIGQNCAATFASVCIGQNATSFQAADVCIGNSAKSTANPGNSVAIGNTSLCNAGRGVAIGDHTTAAGNAVAIGYFGTASGATAIVVGNGSTASATNAMALGSGINNATANSCVIGNTVIANIRPNNTNTCDLGTTGARFNSAYLNSIRLPQSANSTTGTGATLVAGTVTVNTTAVSTGDIVLLSSTASGGTVGIPAISAISNGVSFTITSSSNTDTSTYSWVIVKQA